MPAYYHAAVTFAKCDRITKAPVVEEKKRIPDCRYEHLLSPLKLNDRYTLKNRVVCAPMVFSAAVVGNEYGNASIAECKYMKLEQAAAGGTAMVDVGQLDVNQKEATHLPLPRVDFSARSGTAFNAISEYAWRIKRQGAIALQELGRVSGREGVPGGMEIEEVAEFIHLCEGLIDCVHISSGIYSGDRGEAANAHVVFSKHGYNADMAAYVKSKTTIPVGVIGYINSPDQAEQLIAEGKCDYIVMARQMLCDPDFVKKLQEGRRDEIRQCIGCMHCLEFPDPEQEVPFDGIMPWMKQGNCVINPTSHLHQSTEDMPKPEGSRKVLVIGGGPAGIQAALTASERGHKVVLMEEKEKLGGTLYFAETDAIKGDIAVLKDAMIAQLKHSGAEIRLNTRADSALIAKENADVVIFAVGGHPNLAPIPGIEYARPWMSIYDKPDRIGKKVVMIGGGLVGTEAGLHLSRKGHDVTIVEMQKRIAHESCSLYRNNLIDEIQAAGIHTFVYTTCKEIRPDSVIVSDKEGCEHTIAADTVICALGTVPNATEELEAGLEASVKVIKIGDCEKAGQIGTAIQSGFDAAMSIL